MNLSSCHEFLLKTLFTISIISILFLVETGFSQNLNQGKAHKSNSWSLSIGPEGYYTFYREKVFNTYGLGGTARLEYKLKNDIALTFATGYYNLFSKDNQESLEYLPFKIGFKAYVSSKLYLAAEAGGGFSKPRLYPTTPFSKPISFGLGYHVLKSIDIGLRYENLHIDGNYNSLLALRTAYSFNLHNLVRKKFTVTNVAK